MARRARPLTLTPTTVAASVPMTERAAPNDVFPRLCTIAIPATAKSVSIDLPEPGESKGEIVETFRVPAPDPQRILVLGDTGCRIKGTFVQACNDPVAWPFAGLAKAAAALKPDLVIHLGDYLYRESPCPAGQCRLRRLTLWRQLGQLGGGLLRAGRTAAGGRALDFRSRQSRRLLAGRRRLPPAAGSNGL